MTKNLVYLEHGSIWSAVTGNIIENPAILFDKRSDILLKYGEGDNVRAYYEKMLASHQEAGWDTEHLVLLEMGSEIYDLDSLNNARTIQCYILKRAIEYTASGFLPKLMDHINMGDAANWLEDQMCRVPLNLTA